MLIQISSVPIVRWMTAWSLQDLCFHMTTNKSLKKGCPKGNWTRDKLNTFRRAVCVCVCVCGDGSWIPARLLWSTTCLRPLNALISQTTLFKITSKYFVPSSYNFYLAKSNYKFYRTPWFAVAPPPPPVLTAWIKSLNYDSARWSMFQRICLFQFYK
jgi:hypothetical protein